MGAVDEFFSTVVDGERRQGIPDEQIARDLGISVERLQQLYPPTPPAHRPRGHVGDPFAGVAPYVAPQQPPTIPDEALPTLPEQNGGGVAILVLLWFLAG